jgi:hypothetical protein
MRPVRRPEDELWARNIAEARQIHAHEGQLTVPRKHIELVHGDEFGLGSFVTNARRSS